jgi:hypothetical protein
MPIAEACFRVTDRIFILTEGEVEPRANLLTTITNY